MSVIRAAAQEDLDEVRELCGLVLPQLVMTYSTPWDSRFGRGRTWEEPLLLVASDPAGRLEGFGAASPAVLEDHGLPVPWWCLDMVGVQPECQGRGIGTELVYQVCELARQAGVTCLYGLCVPPLTGWYARLGFSTTDLGAVLDSNVRPIGADKDLTLEARNDQCFFITDISRVPGPRLFLPSP